MIFIQQNIIEPYITISGLGNVNVQSVTVKKLNMVMIDIAIKNDILNFIVSNKAGTVNNPINMEDIMADMNL